MKTLFIQTLLLFLFFTSLVNAQLLSFDQAVENTLANSPELKSHWSSVEGTAGLQMQSASFPNPIFSYSVENVLGNKDWKGWRSAESRYELIQLIEMGGKRGYRQQAAHFLFYAAEAEYEAKKLALINDLMKQYVDVAIYWERLKLAEERKFIADELYHSVIAKVDEGKVSVIQQQKALIALQSACIDVEQSKVDFLNAKDRLAFLMGTPCSDFDNVAIDLYQVEPPFCLKELVEGLQFHPALLHVKFEYLSAHQNFHLEKSQAIPDLTLLLGLKTLRNTGEKGLILGASIPLPIFDRNRGNMAQAKALEQKVQDEFDALKLVLEGKLLFAHKECLRAYQETERLSRTVLQAAEDSFALAQEGYKAGKFEYIEMLDSQRTLFEIRERYIQALMNYHKSKADIEYLNTGC